MQKTKRFEGSVVSSLTIKHGNKTKERVSKCHQKFQELFRLEIKEKLFRKM